MAVPVTNPESLNRPKALPQGVSPAFMAGGGQMGALIRSKDWTTTPLGHVSEWPQSLRTAVSICISSRFPIVLFWGPELVMIYNDAYMPIPGAKHPRSLGQPGLECWAEVRDVVGPMLLGVLTRAEATWSEDLLLPLDRGEGQRESYFTFTYSPIHDETGGVGGVFCAVVETTERVIEERRLRLLHALAETTQAKTPTEACVLAAAHIARSPADIPFSLLYLLDSAGVARLAGSANLDPGTPLAPLGVAAGDRSTWDFEHGALDRPRVVEIQSGPAGARAAVVLPIERSGGGLPFGFIIAGLSPMLNTSASYDRFHNLLAMSVSQAVSNAAAYEDERRRIEALAELDRAKTTFFSNVSHEFRTPLTLMLAPLEHMRAVPPRDDEERERIDLLHRNALRLLKLVNTLLDFSRIEAGRVEAVYEPTDIGALTTDLASSFRSAIERAGLSLVVDCGPLPEPVYVDRSMWEKIVLNLLSNAFKFTFQGSISVRSRALESAVEIEVGDTGIGIAENELPRLFERFHRIEGARSRSHEGSGIGLALVHELVRLHGGEIRVISQEGAGTTFIVRIPRGADHLPPDRIRAERALQSTAVASEAYVEEALRWVSSDDRVPDRGAQPEPGALVRARILVADDNADMRDYLTRLLGEHWEVEAVGDGSLALASIRRCPPDLILSDVMMPGLDGFGLLRAVRGDAALAAIPFVLLSARAGEEATAEGLSQGADDYIVKPFTARALLVRIAARLAATKLARDADDQRRRLYRHFLQAPFPIAVLHGKELVLEVANEGFLGAWGKGPEALGRPIRQALPEIEGQPFPDLLDRVYRTGEP
ncbi:MAG: ATP-binding protein, partial [Polyangiaceae bacterium]